MCGRSLLARRHAVTVARDRAEARLRALVETAECILAARPSKAREVPAGRVVGTARQPAGVRCKVSEQDENWATPTHHEFPRLAHFRLWRLPNFHSKQRMCPAYWYNDLCAPPLCVLVTLSFRYIGTRASTRARYGGAETSFVFSVTLCGCARRSVLWLARVAALWLARVAAAPCRPPSSSWRR